MSIKFKGIILLMLGIFAFSECGGESGGGDTPAAVAIESGFAGATVMGSKATITAGSVTIDMIYANNQYICFPFSDKPDRLVNDKSGLISRRFFMSKTEVTNALMAVVLQWAYDHGKFDTTSFALPNGLDSTRIRHGWQDLLIFVGCGSNGNESRIKYSGGRFTVDSGYENYPVVGVTWYGAIMFCNWLTEMRDGNAANVVYTGINETWIDTETVENTTKSGYRLPYNTEWEYAARYIGTTAPEGNTLASEYIANDVYHQDLTPGYYWTPASYPSGGTGGGYTGTPETDYPRFNPYCWYGGLLEGNTDSLQPVAQKTANQLGFYDMSGNAREWCYDVNGADGRVTRGGSFLDYEFMQLGLYNSNVPNDQCSYLGFRIVRTAD